MDLTKPLTAKQARDLARAIERNPAGEIRFWIRGGESHAQQRMRQRQASEADVRNAIRFGRVSENGMENGTWRYRFETNKFRVVVAFRSETVLVVVTVVRLNWS